jgi:hypothetical protein
MAGSETDLRMLAGEWVGEYRSFETGRSGSIYFKLEAGRDTAFGDVIMVPADIAAMRNNPTIPPSPALANVSRALSIEFVRVSGSMITGTIEPYPSPDCECTLLTVFRGELVGDRIVGSFTTHHSGMEVAAQKGTWWATRKTTK